MQDRVTFPDFSAFQIDMPHGPGAHEPTWPGAGQADPDLYSAFWPEFHARQESGATAAPLAEK